MTGSEREVAELLKEMGIIWSYEHPIFVWDDNKRPRVWAPDFYLIPFGIYIEVCGSDTFDYEYRKKILDSNGYKVIFLHLFKEKNKWRNYLFFCLEQITKNRYNKFNEIFL